MSEENVKQEEILEEKKEEQVSKEQIDAWKQEYGKMYRSTFGPHTFYWHPFNRKTYNETMGGTVAIEDVDELIVERRIQSILKNTVYPSQEEVIAILEDNYGIIESFPNIILEKSGFYQSETDEL